MENIVVNEWISDGILDGVKEDDIESIDDLITLARIFLRNRKDFELKAEIILILIIKIAQVTGKVNLDWKKIELLLSKYLFNEENLTIKLK